MGSQVGAARMKPHFPVVLIDPAKKELTICVICDLEDRSIASPIAFKRHGNLRDFTRRSAPEPKNAGTNHQKARCNGLGSGGHASHASTLPEDSPAGKSSLTLSLTMSVLEEFGGL